MAVSSAQVAVTDVATALNDGTPERLTVKVPSGGATVHLGGSGVTSSTGLELAAGETVLVTVDAGEILYAITATTATVHVLRA